MGLRLLLAGLIAANMTQAARLTDPNSLALNEAKYTVGNPASYTKDLIIQGSLDQNWVKMIVPAPTSVNLLCKLGLLASSAIDFKLRAPSKGEYKLLEHPDSFKASLHQVSHWGWRAFQEAHSSMDEIAQRTTQIPGTLDDAIDVVVAADAEDINDFLPILLDEVTSHIQECKVRASRAKTKFEEMSEIVAEILQGSLSTKAWSELQKSKLDLDNQMKQAQKVDLDTQIKRVNAQVKETKQEVTKWRGKFEEAFDSMPDGWDLLGLQICEDLTNFVGDVLSVATLKFGGEEYRKTDEKSQTKAKKEPSKFNICVLGAQGGSDTKYKVSNREFSSNERVGLSLLNGKLGQIFRKYRQSLSSKAKPKDLSIDSNIGNNLNTFLDHISEPFNKKGVKDDIKTPVLQLIRKVRDTAKEISEHQKTGHTTGKAAKYQKLMDNYLSSATCLESMAREILNLPPVEPATPFDEDDDSAGAGDSAVERHMYMAEKKLSQSEARLTRLEDMYEKKLEKQAKLTASLQTVMNEITRIAATAKTNDAVLEVLKKALILLGDLEKQWKDLTMFFVAVEDRVRVSLAGKVDAFVERLRMGGKRGGVTNTVGKLMYTSLVSASAEVALVNRIARKYVGISGKHIMPSINKAAMMITATDMRKRGQLSADLQNDLSNANTDLEALIRTEKDGFKKAIQQRLKEVRETYEPLLLSVPKKIKAEISASVNKGITAIATIETSLPSALENAAANVIDTGRAKRWSARTSSASATLDF